MLVPEDSSDSWTFELLCSTVIIPLRICRRRTKIFVRTPTNVHTIMTNLTANIVHSVISMTPYELLLGVAAAGTFLS